LVLASLTGYTSSGSFEYIPLSEGIIDVPMFVNMVLFCVNVFIVTRLVSDEQPHGKLNEEEEALFRFFHARSGMSSVQFQHVLKHGDFVEFPPNRDVPNCASTLYLVVDGKISCNAKFRGDFFSHTFFKRSGEFFDIRLFNLFRLPVGFDNLEFRAKTATATKCFRWNVHGLLAMRDAQSPSLKQYWEYMVLTSLTGAAIRHHLKRNDTLYDSLMIPEPERWLDGARSRDFFKEETAPAGTWEHWKRQLAIIRSSMLQVIPPRGVRQHPRLPDGVNPKQAYMELLCKTAEAEAAAYGEEEITRPSVVVPTPISKSKKNLELGHQTLATAAMVALLLLLVDPVTGFSAMNEGKVSSYKLLILGLGRVGLQVAQVALKTVSEGVDTKPIQVVGTVWNKPTSTEEDGIRRVPFESHTVRQELMGIKEADIAMTTHVLFTIPLQRDPDPLMETVWRDVYDWWIENPQGKLGILSTTGVYGDHSGKFVTEDSPLRCEVDSNAELYRKLEEQWFSHAKDYDHQPLFRGSARLFVFRCAGIYDSTRSALHTVYNHGYTKPAPTEDAQANLKTNRVHSSDIARAIVTALFSLDFTRNDSRSKPFRIYNLADDMPESRDIVLSYANELLSVAGCVKPNSTPTTSTILTRSSQSRQTRRKREHKFVVNQRMKDELLQDSEGRLLYPTYREGLRSILTDSSTPWQQAPKRIENVT
jgi:hypothetical protein